MTLPKSASSKRTSLPRASDYSKSFRKDWERLAHSGRFDLKRLKELMILLIANDGPLGPEWLDHALAGGWAAHRECHIGGDFLLIYRAFMARHRTKSSLSCARARTQTCSSRVLHTFPFPVIY